MQKNNLDKTKMITTRRWVGSVNFNFAPSPSWIFACTYSNFTTFTNHRLQSDPFWEVSPADTLSFYQISQQANSSLIHSFGNKSVKHSVSLIGSYQVTGSQQNLIVQPNTTVLNGNIAYSLQLTKSKTSFSVISNYNRAIAASAVTELFGPGFQCSKTFRSLRMSVGTTYNRAYSNAILTGNILSHRAQLSWSPKIKNKKFGTPIMSVNGIYLNKFPVLSAQRKTGELTVTANLGWSF
jgi:hypothetical protein